MRSRCFAWRKMMNRTELFALVKKNYQVEPDYPWRDTNAVLRHRDTKKWFS